MRALVAAVLVAACGHPPAPAPQPVAAPVADPVPVDAPPATQDEILAAIQKAMNELTAAAQQCWAQAATERFDIEGQMEASIDVGAQVHVEISEHGVTPLVPCMKQVLERYPWAPPLHGQSFRLPFRWSAPEGQSVIDRRLVAWHGQGKVSLAVLLDENNTANAGASMFELAIAAGGSTGDRVAERAELWYFLGPATVGTTSVGAGDMMFVPKGAARDVAATSGDVHAMIVVVPGGREGSARAGALPTPGLVSGGKPARPVMLPARAAKTYGPATIYLDATIVKDTPLAASILALPPNATVPEHVHGKETEMLYVLGGGGTITVAGTAVAVPPTSAIQIPPNTSHAFAATQGLRAVQIYTPAGPEQRFKKAP